jgi:hypothetical protein
MTNRNNWPLFHYVELGIQAAITPLINLTTAENINKIK